MSDDPVLRAARLAEIRRQIDARAYETPARLEAALEAFLDRHAPRPFPEGSGAPPHGKLP